MGNRGFYRASDTTCSTPDWIELNFRAIPEEAVRELYGYSEDRVEERELHRLDAKDGPYECPHCEGSGDFPDAEDELILNPAALEALRERAPTLFEPGEDSLPPDSDYITIGMLRAAAGDHECPWCEGAGQLDPTEYELEEARVEHWPAAWGTMWCTEDDENLIADLVRCGFVVYRADGGPFDGEIIFGLDSGGYDFYSAHWAPLRTLRVAWRGPYDDAELHEAQITRVIAFLLGECQVPDDFERVLREGEGGEKYLAKAYELVLAHAEGEGVTRERAVAHVRRVLMKKEVRP